MNERQEKILQIARSLIGPIDYKYQIKDDEVPEKLNCARFTQLLYKNIQIEIGPATIDQAADAGTKIQIPLGKKQRKYYELLLINLKLGDLIFFRGKKGHYDDKRFNGWKVYIGHVGVYGGEGNVIHCFRDLDYGPGEIKEESLDKIIERMGPVVLVKRVL